MFKDEDLSACCNAQQKHFSVAPVFLAPAQAMLAPWGFEKAISPTWLIWKKRRATNIPVMTAFLFIYGKYAHLVLEKQLNLLYSPHESY